MYVLVCPCIMDPDLRAKGITSARDLEAFGKTLDRCRRSGVEIIPLPCPETIYLGRDRAPGGYRDRLDTAEFGKVLDELENEVRKLVSGRGQPSAIIGVDSSPTCGVHWTYYESGPGAEKTPGRGKFIGRFPEIRAIDVKEFARYRVYLAAPLFSEAEKTYNLKVLSLLEKHLYEVYLPQEVGDNTHCRDNLAHREIFEKHVAAIRESDFVVAVVDGADADSGTAWEMGFAAAVGVPVVALRTDFRMVGMCERVNLMLEQSAEKVVSTMEDLPAALGSPLESNIKIG